MWNDTSDTVALLLQEFPLFADFRYLLWNADQLVVMLLTG